MADVLRVLPDVHQPIAPEMLLNLNDISEAATIVTPLAPATPSSLGLISLSFVEVMAYHEHRLCRV